MPIYEYRCESCGADVEKLQKISDPPLRDCPACGKAALVKRVSASSFRLKGSGWYETDFKTGKKKNGVADTAAEAGGSETRTDTGSASGSEGSGSASQSDADTGASGKASTSREPASSATKSGAGNASPANSAPAG